MELQVRLCRLIRPRAHGLLLVTRRLASSIKQMAGQKIPFQLFQVVKPGIGQ